MPLSRCVAQASGWGSSDTDPQDYLALSSHIPSQWYIYPCDEIQPNDLDVGIGSGTSAEMGSEGTSHESRIARGVVAHEEYGGDEELDSVKTDVGEVQARPRQNLPPWFITKPHHYAEAVFLCASWPAMQLVFHMTGVGAQFNEDEARTWVRDLFVGWMTFLVVLTIMVLVRPHPRSIGVPSVIMLRNAMPERRTELMVGNESYS